MLRFSRSTACTASARGLEPSPSSRMVRVIFGQFRPPSNGRALELGHGELGIEALEVADLLVVEGSGKSRRDHGVRGHGEALGDAHDVLPVDGVGHGAAHLHVVEGRLGHLGQQVPRAGVRIAEDLLAGAGIVLQPLEVGRLQRGQVELVVLVGQGARGHGMIGMIDLVEGHVLGAEEVLVLPEHHDLVVLPRLEHEGAVADDVGGLRPLVAELLDGRPVAGQRRQVRGQHREVAAGPLQGHLERPVVLGPDADLPGIGDLLLVERLGVLDVVEKRRVRRGRGRVELALPGVLEVPRGAGAAVRPLRVLADGERPHRAVRIRRHLAGHVGHRLEVDGALHEPGPERGHARAVEVLVVVVARRVVLPPAAAAQAEGLVLGQLLAGSERGRGGRPAAR